MTHIKKQVPWNKGCGKRLPPKECQYCGKIFESTYRVTAKYWEQRRFCSDICGQQGLAGTPRSSRGKVKSPLTDRFWTKVEKKGVDECWLWTGAKNHDGYGKLFKGDRQFYAVHRLSWEMHFGEIPVGMSVCHKCDVRACVNPNHFFLGTFADNMKDKVKKKRQSTNAGERNPRAKLNDYMVEQIKKLRETGMTQQKIAEQFGVSQVAISLILRGKNWK